MSGEQVFENIDEALAAMSAGEEEAETEEPTSEEEETEEETEEEEKPEEEETEEEPGKEETEEESEEESKEAETEEKPEEKPPELTDETVIKVQIGEKEEDLSLGELKEAYGLLSTAKERIQQVNEQTERIQAVLTEITEKPEQALLKVFTGVFDGDGKKAYDRIIQMAEGLVAYHMKLESLPKEQREAFIAQQENATLREKLKAAEEEKAQRKEEEERAATTQRLSEEIGEALTSAEVPVSASTVGTVAQILLQARQANMPVTTEQAVRSYKRTLEKQRKLVLEGLKPDELPETLRKKLKEERIQRVKDKQGRAAKTGKESSQKRQEKKILSPSDVFSWY